MSVGPVPVRDAVGGQRDRVVEPARGRFVERILPHRRAHRRSLRGRARTRRREAGIDGNGRTLAQFLPDYRPRSLSVRLLGSTCERPALPSSRLSELPSRTPDEHRPATTRAETAIRLSVPAQRERRGKLAAPGPDHVFQAQDMHVTGQSVGKIPATRFRSSEGARKPSGPTRVRSLIRAVYCGHRVDSRHQLFVISDLFSESRIRQPQAIHYYERLNARSCGG